MAKMTQRQTFLISIAHMMTAGYSPKAQEIAVISVQKM